MAISSFKPLQFNDEPLYKAKMNQLADNVQYVYENMPTVQYDAYVKKTNGVKILAGIASGGPTGISYARVQVYFGNFFTAGCKPVVVASTQPSGNRWRYITAVKGLSTIAPDHTGLNFIIGADAWGSSPNIIDERVYVHWIAIGW